ncbi:MAG: autotransporter-associated beta strand repeat-containing protein [Verrucomicrobia bacterium]|nr:autotransporter-associated beta strand repeat-containing protein [Verrucomicrobiota bacterium]
MKTKHSRFLSASALALIALAISPHTMAATGTWNVNTAGSWTNSANWSGGTIPDAAGDVANLTFNISSSRSVALDGVRTVGSLEIGDPNSTFAGYSVTAGTGGQLVFDNNGSGATLKYSPAGNTAANTISAPILLDDNLTINALTNTSASAAPSQNITGLISDGTGTARTITKTGVGYVTLSGANTYRGGTTVSAGRIAANNASALGTGDVTVASGGQIYLGTASAVYSNNFSIAGTGCSPVTAETNAVNQLGAIRFQNNTLAGSLTLTAAARVGAASGVTGTLNGALAGGFPLAINSTDNANHTGVITLNGNASAYTNTITVARGGLKLGSSSNLAGNLTVSDGAALYANNIAGDGTAPSIGGTLTLGTATGASFHFDPTAAAHAQAGSVSLAGTNTLNLTGPATEGTVTVLGATGGIAGTGTLALGGTANYRAGTAVTIGANSITLTVDSSDLSWTGAADGAWDFTTANWDASTFHHLDNVSFTDAATATAVTIGTGITVLPNSIAFANSAKNYTISGAGSIGGGASLTKSGTGSLTITNTNTFSGGTVLSEGQLMVSSAAALGTGPLALHGGQLSSNNNSNAPAFTVPASFDGTVTLGHATNIAGMTFGGTNTLAGNTTINVALPEVSSNNVALSTALSDGDSSFKLTKTGPGILRLFTANSYDGGTLVEGGTLYVSSGSAMGTGAVTASGTMSGGGMILYGSSGTYAKDLTLSGSGAVLPGLSNLSGDGALNLNTSGIVVSGNITLAGNTRIGGYISTNATISGSIGESGTPEGEGFSLDLGSPGAGNGAGTIIVSGNNTYTGNTNIYRGVVRANSNTAFGGTGTVTVSGGSGTLIKAIANHLEIGANITLANDFVLSSDLRTNATATTQTWGVISGYPGDSTTLSTATVTGDVSITATPGNGGHFASQGNVANILRVTGEIDSSVSVLIANGNVEFGGGGNYEAATLMQGTLRPCAADGIATNAVLTLGSVGAATLDLNGFNQTLAGLVKSTNGVTVTNGSTTSATLSLVPSANFTYAGTIGVTGQPGALNLNIGGTDGAVATLSGSSTDFAGVASVTAGGTLKLTGTLGNASSVVTCGNGGTLDGTGTFGGTLALESNAAVKVDPASGHLKSAGTIGVSVGGVVAVTLANSSASDITVLETTGGTISATPANFHLTNPGYPNAQFSIVGNKVILNTGAFNLTWTGASLNGLWDIVSSGNWTAAGTPMVFSNGSGATFDNTAVDRNVHIASLVQPSSITFDNDSAHDYMLTDDGGGSVSGTTLTKNGNGTAVINVPLSLSAGIALNAGNLEIRPSELSGSPVVLDKPVTGSGMLAIANSTNDPVTVSNANTGFTGPVVIAKGGVQATASNALGSGTITFGNSATQPGDIASLTLGAGVSVANPVVVSANAESSSITGAGTLTGGASLTKLGGGTLTISTANSFTGDTVIEAGTIRCAATNALSADTTVRFGTFNTGSADTILDVSAPTAAKLSLTPTVSSQAILRRGSGTGTVSGPVELNSRNLVIQGNAITLSGAVSGLGGLVVDTSSSGPVVLSGTANTFSGNIQVDSGIFQAGSGGGSSDCVPDGSSVVLGATGTFQVAASDAINGLSGAPGSAVSAASSSPTLTIGASNASSVFEGVLSNGSGSLNLTKAGTGDLTLTGISTATGNLTVSGGRVILNGSAAFLPVLPAGGTLTGTGTLQYAGQADNSFFLFNGNLAPGNNGGGNTAGTLTIANNLMISAGGALTIRVADWAGTTPGVSNDVLACRKIDWTGGSYTLNLDFTGMANFSESAKEFTIVTTTNGAFPPGSNVIQINTTGFAGTGTWKVKWATGDQSKLVAVYTPAAGYASWASTKGLTESNNAPGMDPDNDGISNLEEYYLNGNPLAGDPSILPDLTIDGTYVILSFDRQDAAETDVTTQSIEYGSSLGTWPHTAAVGAASAAADANGVIVTVAENGTDPDHITVKIPRAMETQGRLFSRLMLVKP